MFKIFMNIIRNIKTEHRYRGPSFLFAATLQNDHGMRMECALRHLACATPRSATPRSATPCYATHQRSLESNMLAPR